MPVGHMRPKGLSPQLTLSLNFDVPHLFTNINSNLQNARREMKQRNK